MTPVEKAVAILLCMKHAYPACFRAFGMNDVLALLVSTGGKS